MANKDFKVKNKLQVGGITTSGPVVSDAYGNLDSTSSIATQFGGTGTTTSPTSGQILYSASGTNYAPATLAGLPGTYAVGNTASRPGSPSIGQIYSNTQTNAIEVYTSSGWSAIGVIPKTPTVGSATDIGTSRAFNNGSATIAFTPDETGGLASTYTATSSPSGFTGSASSSPVTVAGLQSNTAYTFTVIATNSYGNATATGPTSSITATTVPQTPTIGTPTNVTGVAFGSSTSASVPVTANATGGKTVSGFTVTSSPGSLSATGTSPVTVPGLTSGTSYTFTAVANNANGSSTATSASSSLTPSTVPQAPTIGTASGGGAGVVSVTFTANETGGSAITGFTVTSSSGRTGTGSSSPITVNEIDAGTYTYRVIATNANGSSAQSSASNSVTSSFAYSLSQTFNSSGTFTVPSDKTQIAVFLMGGGNSGQAGIGGRGGGGGSSGGAIGFKDYAVTSGQNYAVVVASAGGTSSFGTNIAQVSSTAQNYPVGASFQNAAGGGSATSGATQQGFAGSAGPSINLSNANLPTFTVGGSGGGGGGGGAAGIEEGRNDITYQTPGSGGSGGAGGGGAGGTGGYFNDPGTPYSNNFPTSFNAGQSGSSGSQRGAGGGGGGGYSQSFTGTGAVGNGGAGAAGQVVVYVR
jgi:hypothetical protein